MSTQQSWVWEHFQKCDKDIAKCNYCNKKLLCKYSSTSGINRHLKEVHSIAKNNKQPKIIKFISSSKTANPCTPDNKKKIDRLIANFVTNKLVPIDIVEDKSFKDLINYLAPNYKILTRKSIKLKITETYEQLKQRVISKVQEFNSISVDFDTWSSVANESYITVNCHGIGNDWKLYTFNLETRVIEESHRTEDLKNIIEVVLKTFIIEDKVLFNIHDNASNMNLVSLLLGFIDIRCFCHTWDLALRSASKEGTLKIIIDKARKILGHFKRSPTAQKRFQSFQTIQKLKLKQCTETRWGSIYEMLDRLYINKSNLEEFFMQYTVCDDFLLELNEWKLIKEILPLLRTICAVYDLMSAEKYCTQALVYPTVTKFLNTHLKINESDSKVVINFKNIFRREIEKRFKPNDISIATSPAIISSILSPQYKELTFVNNNIKRNAYSELKEQMIAIDNNLNVQNEDSDTEVDITDNESTEVIKENAMEIIFGRRTNQEIKKISINEEFSKYMNISTNMTNDLMSWWKENESQYPRLSVLAKKYLAIPSSSVSSERIFSKAGHLISQRRSMLRPNIVNKIIFNSVNYDRI